MKKIIAALALVIALGSANAVNGQIRLNVNVNLGAQPSWGPRGYDYVEYYYLPDLGAYYYVPTHQFIYMSGGRWIYSASLPPMYRHYDLYSGYKVVINQPNAYMYHNQHRVKYGHFKGNNGRAQYFRKNNSKNRDDRGYRSRRRY